MEKRITIAQQVAGTILILIGIGIFGLAIMDSTTPTLTFFGIHYLFWVGLSQLIAGILVLIASKY